MGFLLGWCYSGLYIFTFSIEKDYMKERAMQIATELQS